jgi:hypothetical protein
LASLAIVAAASAHAQARLLFGDADPGGRLPVTFPRDESEGPATQRSEYAATIAEDGSIADTHLDEGIFVGYRSGQLRDNDGPLLARHCLERQSHGLAR